MDFEWDEAKDAANRAKHGIGFDLATRLDWHLAVEIRDARIDYGEVRRIAYLYSGDRLFVCVYTQRGTVRRIISLRKANKREEHRYGR